MTGTCVHCGARIVYVCASGIGWHWVHVVPDSIYCDRAELVQGKRSTVARPS